MPEEQLKWSVCTKRTGWRCHQCQQRIEQCDRYAIADGRRSEKYCAKCRKEE